MIILNYYPVPLCSYQKAYSKLKKVDFYEVNDIKWSAGWDAVPLTRLRSVMLSYFKRPPFADLFFCSLFDCQLSAACCPRLSEALMSDRCLLTELDLSLNNLGQEGALLLCHALRRPGCPIEKLRWGLPPVAFEHAAPG